MLAPWSRFPVEAPSFLVPSLPSCMCPFPCQSVLPPMTLHRPLPHRSPIVPTNPVNVASFPQTPSMLHRSLHCPLPTGLASPPHTLVNAPSSVDVLSPPVHCHPPPSRLHHSLYRRFPHWATVVASLVHASLPLSNGPFAVD